MRGKQWLVLIGFIALSEGAGTLGSLFTIPSIAGWYATLARPQLAPPNWVFGPVWTTLFLLMGIAAFLVWCSGGDRKDVRIGLGIFLLQLVLNVLWSVIFFGYHNLGGACIEIVFLWFAIIATIAAFARISNSAALLLLPYLAWVSYAAYLTYTFWSLAT
ncbi:MAG: tryptophan-rich sensory protein [Candidatus Pacebacteria bacterium]|nr:tryptophan-rich sensory protein [Candidatus Paceibacterota bacterium]